MIAKQMKGGVPHLCEFWPRSLHSCEIRGIWAAPQAAPLQDGELTFLPGLDEAGNVSFLAVGPASTGPLGLLVTLHLYAVVNPRPLADYYGQGN